MKQCLLCGITKGTHASPLCSVDAAAHGVQLVPWAREAEHFWIDAFPAPGSFLGRGVSEILEQVRDIVAGREDILQSNNPEEQN